MANIIDDERKKIIFILFFVMYVFTVLWYTVLNRSVEYHFAQYELFWSYKSWFAGDWLAGKEVLANIAMFIPFGFLLSGILKNKRHLYTVVLFAFLFSAFIEISQYIFTRGLFEFDDMLSNTLGAVLGLFLFLLLNRLSAGFKDTFFRVFGITVIFVCSYVLLGGFGIGNAEVDSTSRAYCFQIDDAEIKGNELVLNGFAFRYDNPSESYEIILRSLESGIKTVLSADISIPRTDVNEYFLCDYDYSNTGFHAKGEVNPGEEYEVMIKWPWRFAISTGLFLTGNDVHYYPSGSFVAPDSDNDLKYIVKDGILRVYRPDYHCWVYQLNNSLYWIAEPGFFFEPDGTTYIQYQLWTTQEQNLPKIRLNNNWMWDNIGGCFEKYELHADYGPYRVMKRELPREYSITSIVTGYYRNGSWIWKNYFRPYYLID